VGTDIFHCTIRGSSEPHSHYLWEALLELSAEDPPSTSPNTAQLSTPQGARYLSRLSLFGPLSTSNTIAIPQCTVAVPGVSTLYQYEVVSWCEALFVLS